MSNRRDNSHPHNPSAPPAPTSTDALLQQGYAHHIAGQLAEAEPFYRRVLELSPDHPAALQLLSQLALQVGQNAVALELIDRALQVNPSGPGLDFIRGNILFGLARYQDAASSYTESLRLQPQQPEAHNNLGSAYHVLGQYQAAVDSFDNAIRLKPGYPEAHTNRGNTLFALRRYKEAVESCDQAIRLQPTYAEAHCKRANALLALQQYTSALESYNQAILLNPDSADALCNRGDTLYHLQRYPEALESCDQAIRLNPNNADTYSNRGNIFLALKQYPDALASFNHALRLKPDCEYLLGIRIHLKGFLCDWGSFENDCRQLEAAIARGERAAVPFALLPVISSPSIQKQAAEIYARDKTPPRPTPAISHRLAHAKIRIGYFSSDYYTHATSYLIAELLERHDRTRFEIFGFSFGPGSADPMRRRVSAAMDRFLEVRALPDHAIAALSRKLKIDIAVDLKGFTRDSRPGIFAERAAPIQVNYLGYPGTMAADYIDYLIADPTLIPEASQPHYSEKIVCLPDTYQPNDTHRPISTAPLTRAAEQLPESAFVFCCFNNTFKITPTVFDPWMRILAQVDRGVLWLLEENPWAPTRLRDEAARRGIAPHRLVFAKPLPIADHLARHRLADLFLDTTPYNAHTTASDALWAGLPVLTRIGDTFAGRVAASLLRAIDLPELITTTEADYIAAAVSLARNPQHHQALRHRLQHNRLTTPLFDIAAFTRHLEAAYTAICDRHRAGLPPAHIHIAKLS